MRTILLAFFIVASPLLLFGQNTTSTVCDNQTAETISSRGIKLEMSPIEILNLFVRTEAEKQAVLQQQPNFGYLSFVIKPRKEDLNFEGINLYYLSFLDNQLNSFTIYYAKPKWKDGTQFVETIIKSFNLPTKDKWLADANNGRSFQLNCGDYTIKTNLAMFENPDNELSVYNNKLNAIIRERREKAEDEVRQRDIKAFKP